MPGAASVTVATSAVSVFDVPHDVPLVCSVRAGTPAALLRQEGRGGSGGEGGSSPRTDLNCSAARC